MELLKDAEAAGGGEADAAHLHVGLLARPQLVAMEGIPER
jgi:hypothetical protein